MIMTKMIKTSAHVQGQNANVNQAETKTKTPGAGLTRMFASQLHIDKKHEDEVDSDEAY